MNTLDHWLTKLEALDITRIELGLDRVSAVLNRLTLFADHRPYVITVAGTNGKGSSVALLEAILIAQGYRVGAYTSPHLHHYTERVRLDGKPVGEQQMAAALNAVEQERGDIPLTYFEFTTLAALQIFDQAKLDVVILEVGLGGRLDAVNAVDADLALITTISVDHADWLGNDIETIGYEKAGIMRPGKVAVFAGRHCPSSVVKTATDLGVKLYRAGVEYQVASEGDCFALNLPDGRLGHWPRPALQGEHQIDNAAGVLVALAQLPESLVVTPAAIKQGLRTVRHAGRSEFFDVDGVTVLLDVAHNEEGAAALAQMIRQWRQEHDGRVLAVFSALADKNIPGMIHQLADQIEQWWLAPLTGPRGLSLNTLVERVRHVLNLQTIHCESDPLSAYNCALMTARPGDLVVVFGSFLIVSAVHDTLTTGK